MYQKDNGCFNRVYGKTWIGHHLVAGQPRQSSVWFETRNPSHQGDRVGRFPVLAAALWFEALESARQAQILWAASGQRSRCLRHFLQSLSQQQENLARWITRETGWPVQATRIQIQGWIQSFSASQALLPESPLTVLALPPSGCEPPVREILPALQALFQGSALIWCPGSQLPATAQYLAELLQQADLPPGVFQLLHGPKPPSQEAGTSAMRWLEPLPPVRSTPLLLSRNAALREGLQAAQERMFEPWSPGRIVLIPQHLLPDFKYRLLKSLTTLRISDPNLDHRALAGPLASLEQLRAFLRQAQAAGSAEIRALAVQGRESRPEPFCGDPEQGLFVWPMLWEVAALPQNVPVLAPLAGPGLYLLGYATDSAAEKLQQALSLSC